MRSLRRRGVPEYATGLIGAIASVAVTLELNADALLLKATNSCGLSGQKSKSLAVFLDHASLAILAPSQDAVLRVVDDQGKPLPPGEVGEIAARGRRSSFRRCCRSCAINCWRRSVWG